MSELAGPVEDIESPDLDVGAVGSRIGEFLLECFVITLWKRACRLAKLGPMSRFRGSLEKCGEAVKNVFLLNDFNKYIRSE